MSGLFMLGMLSQFRSR